MLQTENKDANTRIQSMYCLFPPPLVVPLVVPESRYRKVQIWYITRLQENDHRPSGLGSATRSSVWEQEDKESQPLTGPLHAQDQIVIALSV
jgi:hypothetical protein